MTLEFISKPEIIGLFKNLETQIQEAKRNTFSGGQCIYDTDALCKKLKVSKRTLQNWRDEGLIEFSQIGHKIYYTEKAVNQLLERTKVKVFNKYV